MSSKRTKSYNKLPRPVPQALATWAALTAVAVALRFTMLPDAAPSLARALRPLLGKGLAVTPDGLLVVIAIAAGVASAIFAIGDYLAFHNGVWAGEKPSASSACGSARLASRPSELKKRFHVWKRGEEPEAGIVVGGIGGRRDRLLVDTRRLHKLLIGPTGSGKSTSCLAPSQLCLIDADCSTVTLDPKGEIYALTAQRAIDRGANVVLVDFSDASRSDGWNPLQPAIDCAKGDNGRSPDEMPGELRVLASTLVSGKGSSSPLWPNAARILFCGLAGFTASSGMVPDECRNLSTVATLAAMPQKRVQRIVEALPRGSAARLQLASVAFAPDETFGGFSVNLTTELSPFADPGVSPMLARSGFRVEDFLDGQVCVYVKFNSSTEAYNPLIAAFAEQTVGSLRRLAENRCGGTLPRTVHLLLEELPQLPRVSLGKTLAICRSQGILATVCIQSRGMLKAVYKEDAPGMFDNLDTTIFLKGGNDLETNRYYSDALGCYTVESVGTSATRGSASASRTESRSYREARLFRPEDLARWGYETGHLVIQDGQAYACSALPLSRTFLGDELGLNGREPDAAKRAELAPERPVKNPAPAPAWHWGEGDAEAVADGIAAAISAVEVDPRDL